jgi:hypothetical protein
MVASDLPHAAAALPGERASGTRSLRGWVGRRAGLDMFDRVNGLDCAGSEWRPVAVFCERSDELSCFIKRRRVSLLGERVSAS